MQHEHKNTITSPPQSHLWRARHHPSWQRMHSSALCATQYS